MVTEMHIGTGATRIKIVCINCELTLEWTQRYTFTRSMSAKEAWNRRVNDVT